MIERVNPPGMSYVGMSQAVRNNDRILVSGQVALGEGGIVVGEGDGGAQARQAFANLQTVLEASGSGLKDVVKLTCFLTTQEAYPGYAEAKADLFADNPPASTVVIISELLVPGLLLEIEAEAWVSE